MKEIAISKFKDTCIAVLEGVRRSRSPVRVTRFGKPVADIIPVRSANWLGCMVGTAKIRGDIVQVGSDARDWEAFR